MENLCKNLRSILDNKNISLQELSLASGIPFETIKNIYYGKVTDPKLSTITAIAKALNVYYCELIDDQMPSVPSSESQIIINYRKCGSHGKALIQMVSEVQAKATELERDSNDKHTIDCLVPTDHLEDGINNATCTINKISTSVKDAFIGYKITTNNFTDYNYCFGDTILLEYRDPKPGERAVFTNGVKSYFRILEKEDSMWVLKPMNKLGNPIYCKRLNEWTCIGVCIDVIRV